jgi:1-acyl-sn-glycerol-3-phosphate acyltransferase
MKSSNPVKTLYLIIQMVLATAKLSLDGLVRGSRGTLTRKWVDQRMHTWAKKIMHAVRADIQVINPNHVAPKHSRPTLLMCNHSSLFDIPITYAALPGITLRMLAKAEMKKIPLMGKSMVAADFPFINRHNRIQAIKDLQQVKELLADDVVMWVAPEGTRSADGKLAKFKKGGFITAIQSQAEIIPMVIIGANDILPARTFRLKTHQKIKIYIGEPIDASQYDIEQKDELMRIVHHSMAVMLEGAT